MDNFVSDSPPESLGAYVESLTEKNSIPCRERGSEVELLRKISQKETERLIVAGTSEF